jgi:hypothetical protein
MEDGGQGSFDRPENSGRSHGGRYGTNEAPSSDVKHWAFTGQLMKPPSQCPGSGH